VISKTTVYTVRVAFDPKDYGPMPDDPNVWWRSPTEALDDLCMAIESAVESDSCKVSEIGSTFKGLVSFFEASTDDHLRSLQIELTVKRVIASRGGCVL
jgi:hypothetical protein